MSSSRPSRLAASSRAFLMSSANCFATASEKLSEVRSTIRLSCASWRRSTSAKPAWIRWVASVSSVWIRVCSSRSRSRRRSATSWRARRRSRSCASSSPLARSAASRAARSKSAERVSSRDRCSSPAASSRSVSSARRETASAISCSWRGRRSSSWVVRALSMRSRSAFQSARRRRIRSSTFVSSVVQLRARMALALADHGSALLRQAPLLVDEARERLRTRHRERSLELASACLGLVPDHRVEPLLGLDQAALRVAVALEQTLQREQPELERRADGQARSGQGDVAPRLECKHDPGARGTGGQDRRRVPR